MVLIMVLVRQIPAFFFFAGMMSKEFVLTNLANRTEANCNLAVLDTFQKKLVSFMPGLYPTD